ncbi:MAG TPA: radical SAM protein [Bryobacteraceae bacterium]|jgi:DNA repair photolyase|nr:radical SAM protein [Bryobacteraceae bacterium]
MLVGIARLAAGARTLEAKRRVEYLEIESRSFITRCDSDRVPFRWTINPYRGCEFGCKYCYARYAHEFMELRDPLQFERKIFAKRFDRAQFRRELTRLPMGETIALGTATDPYQPAERRFRITRSVLEVFAATAGYRLGITSKSDLIARDLDLLREISRRHYLSVHITITSMDRDLDRLIEPMAPRPDLRMNAVRKLAAAGIRVGVFCSPVMPLINDSEPGLDAIAKSARGAGANNFGANVLFLKPCSYAVFLPFLESHFPLLVRRYRERFEKSAYLKGEYPKTIQDRVAAIRRRYGFHPQAQPEPALWPKDPQLTLF